MLLPGAANILAGPEGGTIAAGEGAIARPDPATTHITQYSHGLAVDWQSFNLAVHERVQFNQPGSQAWVLNRIFDQQPSQIFGRIDANGRVLLVNPNGIWFGPSARLNVGALVAAGLEADADDLLAGHLDLAARAGAGGAVVNQGLIAAATGGEVALIGRAVRNEGAIVAHAGRVTLAAGDRMALDFDGDGLMRFSVDSAVIENALGLADAVANTGAITAHGGQVLLSAQAARDVFTNAVNNAGVIRAQRIERAGGVIRLLGQGPDARVVNAGELDARGDTASGGGWIEVSGAEVVIEGGGVLDASGASGGVVHIGGGIGGGDPGLRNARTTTVAHGAEIRADARAGGDGGEVVVWSDDTTRFAGHISARGGARSGDGGFAEISGKRHLYLEGFADLRAPGGRAGDLLLDPGTVTICHLGGVTCAATQTGPDVFSDDHINTQLGLGNLVILTQDASAGDEDINFEADVAITWADNTFTLSAGRNVLLAGSIDGTGAAELHVEVGQDDAGGTLTIGDAIITATTFSAEGGAGDDTLIGANAPNTWVVNGADAGTLNGGAFTAFENLSGGTDTDDFTLSAALSGTLSGGAGNDTFAFGAGGAVLGDLVGGNGAADHLNLANAGGGLTLNLQAGTVAPIGGTFAGLEQFTGDGALDTIVAPDGGATVTVTGQNDGSIGAIAFVNFANVTGGAGDDSFTLNAGGSLTAALDGAGGTDSLTVTVASTFTVSGADSGSVTNVGGGFSDIEALIGGAGDDSFNFLAGGSVALPIDGGGGGLDDDTVSYAAVVGAITRAIGIDFSDIESVVGNGNAGSVLSNGSVWSITGADSGAVDGIDFSDWPNLTGTAGADSFTFIDPGTLSGSVNGLGGNDTAGWAAAAPIAVEPGVDFDNVETIIGGDAATALFTVIGTTFDVTGANDGTVDGVTFINWGNLRGTAGDDRFTLHAGGSITGAIDGQTGVDLLAGDDAAVTFTVTSADGGGGSLLGSFDEIEELIGSSGADTFDFDALFAGVIDGAAGSDTADWSDTAGIDIDLGTDAPGFEILIGGGAGFSLSNGVIWTLTGASSGTVDGRTFIDWLDLTGTAGADTFDLSGVQSADLHGAGGADSFTFSGAARLIGSLDGGAGGIDAIDLSASTLRENVTITAGGGLHGNQGMFAGLSGDPALVSGGFDNIDSLAGNNLGTLIGPAGDTRWIISGANSGTYGSATGLENTFAGFAVQGQGGADRFTFSGLGSLGGGLDGGGGADEVIANASVGSRFAIDGAAAGRIDPDGAGATPETGFASIERLVGGAFTDTFEFSGADWTGDLDGAALGAVLDFTAHGAQSVVLSGLGGVSGFAGQTLGPAIGGRFDNITEIHNPNAGLASLTGANLASDWTLAGAAGGMQSGARSLVFSGFDELIGGTQVDRFELDGDHTGDVRGGEGDDEFRFADGVVLSGDIDGGAGDDRLDFSAYTTARAVRIVGLGATDGVRGVDDNGGLSGEFGNIDRVTGSGAGDQVTARDVANAWLIDGADTFTLNGVRFSDFGAGVGGSVVDTFSFSGGSLSIGLDGAGGADRISGPNTAGVWTLGGLDEGDLDGTAFVNVENLTGGTANDRFAFANDAAAVSGTLDGGGGGGNVLDYSGRSAPIVIDLAAGTATAVGTPLRIHAVVGSAGFDSLIGPDSPNVWTLAGASAGDVNGSLSFAGIEHLTGGSLADRFAFAPGGSAGGMVNGAGGADTLDYTHIAAPVSFDMRSGTASLIGAGAAGIERFIGGSASDTLLALDDDNVWSLAARNEGSVGGFQFAGVENLTGGSGADRFALNGEFVDGVIDGRGGIDQLVQAGANTWRLTGADSGTLNGRGFASVENLAASGALQNTLAFDAGGSLSGLFSAGSILLIDAVIDNGGLPLLLSGAVESAGNVTFDADLSIDGDISGADWVFNGNLQIRADTILRSTTNVFDFNALVGGTGNLTIDPTPGTDIAIDLADGPGHIAAGAFVGLQGHLIIGGVLDPLAPPAVGAQAVAIDADTLSVNAEFFAPGPITLLASNINLNANLVAGPRDNRATVTLLAVGDTQGSGSGPGDITGPASGTAIIGGSSAVLIANNAIVNAQNIALGLEGGDLFVAVSPSADQPLFDTRSNVNAVEFDPADLVLISSLTNPIAVEAVLPIFTNFAELDDPPERDVDEGVFEEGVTLYGVIGTGIALSLDQCEDLEGCAPRIGEEELNARIAELDAAIEAAGGGDASALAELERERAEWAAYREELRAFLAAQSDFGNEFIEFEEGAAPAAPVEPPVAEPPAAPPLEPALPAADSLEDRFEEIEIAPRPPPAEPPPEEFEEIEEFDELEFD
jgi:filamentous hemagglutinin family protein